VRQGRAENRACAESKKDRTPNKVATSPGQECAKEREGGEQSKVVRLGIHFRSRMEGLRHLSPPQN
jgi:hypothetical protein